MHRMSIVVVGEGGEEYCCDWRLVGGEEFRDVFIDPFDERDGRVRVDGLLGNVLLDEEAEGGIINESELREQHIRLSRLCRDGRLGVLSRRLHACLVLCGDRLEHVAWYRSQCLPQIVLVSVNMVLVYHFLCTCT